MKKGTKYAALLLGLTTGLVFASPAVYPGITAYAAAWEKNSAGSYVASDGSAITGVLSRGIDVSHWKQSIDWKKVAADDVDFVMLGTRYNNAVDPYFATNAVGAYNAGLKVGAYIYSYATTVEMAEAEADFVLDLIKDYPISYPVVIDVEDESMSKLSPTELANVINAFCQKVEMSGYYPMVYSNDYWLSNKIDLTKLHYDVWAARYDVKPTYTGAAIWQATNQGEVDGISGAVDLNFTMKDLSSKLIADRWRLIGDQWYYYKNYVKQTGWINDGQSWYCLNTDGTQLKGWVKQNDDFYYLLPETGQLQTGWKKIEDSWYYLGTDGRMANEWITVDEKQYYLLNGVMVTGWLRIDNDYYFMRGDGSMATGWRNMDGNYYYFGTDGRLIRGWAKLDNKLYYMKSDGTMATGWQTIDNKTYYFNPDGDMATKWTEIEDYWYYFSEEGAMMTGWIQLNGRYYYMHTDGRMVTGWQSDGTNSYYMDPISGKMAMGWKEIDKDWYYFNTSGHMIKGWLNLENQYYYLNPQDGKMVSNGSFAIDGINYTFDQDGVCQNEFSAVDGGSAGSTMNSPTGNGSNNGMNVTVGTSNPGAGNAPGMNTGTTGTTDNFNNATIVNPGSASGSPENATVVGGLNGAPGSATDNSGISAPTSPDNTAGNSTGNAPTSPGSDNSATSGNGSTYGPGSGTAGTTTVGPGAGNSETTNAGSGTGNTDNASSGNSTYAPGTNPSGTGTLSQFQTGGPK